MRISELSKQTGVSSATIKYYTRENLLPAGTRSGYNSTDYDQSHVVRLRLIRALIDTGGLSVETTGRVLVAIDDHDMPPTRVFGIAQQAVPRAVAEPSQWALEQVRSIMRERGWATTAANPGIAMAASALDGFAATGRTDMSQLASGYAVATDLIAEADIDNVAKDAGLDRQAETVVVGIPLGDALLAGLRRIAQESLTFRRYLGGVVPSDQKEPS